MMKYLYIFEDGAMSQKIHPTVEDISQEDLQNVDDGVLTILRFNPEAKQFECLIVDSEEVQDDEDDEDNEETHTEYSIDRWAAV